MGTLKHLSAGRWRALIRLIMVPRGDRGTLKQDSTQRLTNTYFKVWTKVKPQE